MSDGKINVKYDRWKFVRLLVLLLDLVRHKEQRDQGIENEYSDNEECGSGEEWSTV